MTVYDNTNTGALFTNKKRTIATQPQYTGRININGAEFWLSAWLKTSKAGEQFMSLAVTPAEPQAPVDQTPVLNFGNMTANPADIDQDIPF